MTALIPPAAGEVSVVGTELWWRQCPPGPAFFDEVKNQPSDVMFRWNDIDAGKLSGARATKSTAEEAYVHHVNVSKKQSKGTWGVPASTAAKVSSQLLDDSLNLPAPPASPPGHTYLDMRKAPSGSTMADKASRFRIRSRLLLEATLHHAAPEAKTKA